MDSNNYLRLFIEETQEHLQAISDNLLAFEKTPTDLEIVNTIFRSAHTLKGMAGAMQYENMAHLTHEMESILDELRAGRLQANEHVLNVLLHWQAVLQRQLDQIMNTGSEVGIEIDGTIAMIRAVASREGEWEPTPQGREAGIVLDEGARADVHQAISVGMHIYAISVTVDPSSSMPSVRGFMVKKAYEDVGEVIASDPNDPASDAFTGTLKLVLATELDETAVRESGTSVLEVVGVEVQSLQPGSVEMAATATAVTGETVAQVGQTVHPTRIKSVRVDVERLDALMNLYSEFVIDKTRLEQLAHDRRDSVLTETVRHLSRIGADLQDIIMKIRMVPLETVFNRFPRMVRDLSKALGKKVNFVITGADMEIDRLLSDEIADPLVHLLRNAMDHGLETPEERTAVGKEKVGTVLLSAYQAGNHVFIEIRDDGRGINRDKVLQKAIQQGLVLADRAESLPDEAVHDFLFHPGFSTADKVSDISGRGVGLDAVRNKIQALSGSVTVQSRLGEGSTFVICLPLTVGA